MNVEQIVSMVIDFIEKLLDDTTLLNEIRAVVKAADQWLDMLDGSDPSVPPTPPAPTSDQPAAPQSVQSLPQAAAYDPRIPRRVQH